eukprot:NODE_184_length_15718_cov_0.161342.p10 type:complete len:213 gc:universal NODE_184_length_15718_cov_0.161342:14168-14806(+)
MLLLNLVYSAVPVLSRVTRKSISGQGELGNLFLKYYDLALRNPALDQRVYDIYRHLKGPILKKQPYFRPHVLDDVQKVTNIKQILKDAGHWDKSFWERSSVKVLKQIFVPASLFGLGAYIQKMVDSDPSVKKELADNENKLPPGSPISGLRDLPVASQSGTAASRAIPPQVNSPTKNTEQVANTHSNQRINPIGVQQVPSALPLIIPPAPMQ